MKIFNKMTRQQFVDGHLIPTNAFYGRLILKYTDRVFTGKIRPIFDKDGYPIFRPDGVQATRRVYKRVEKAVEVTYSLEDLFPVSVGDHTYFKAWYKVGRDGHWRDESVLNHNAIEITLNNFIVRKVQEYCTQNKVGLFDLCTGVERPHLNRTRQCAQQAAHRREVQKRYIYTGGERSLMGAKFVFTDGVRIDAPMGKGVIASHKDAFGVKPTIDTAEKVAGTQSAIGFAVVGKKVNRVVYTNRAVAEQAARDCKSHYLVGGTFDNIERLVDSGKLEHSVDFSSDTFIVSRR